MTEEQKYEVIQFVAKTPRADGQSWFDWLFDLTTEVCEGTDSDEDDCTCGMETMSGSRGTLEQCYDWTTTVGNRLQPIHLARVIVHMAEKLDYANIAVSEDVQDVVSWARREIEFEEKWDNWTPEDEEDEASKGD